MSTLLKNHRFKILTYLVTFSFFMAGPVQSYSASRIVPSQKVELYNAGQLKQVLQEEAPLPIGSVMHTSGRAGLRMNTVYMVAEDGCRLSVLEDSDIAKVQIDEGLLFFAATPSTGQVVFNTPTGVLSTQKIAPKVSDQQPVVKAFVDVRDAAITMGVMEGGSITLATPEGVKTVEEGKQIVLAQNGTTGNGQDGQQGTPDDAQAQEDDDDDDRIPAAYFWAGGAALGLIALIGMMGGSSSDGGSTAVNPSSAPISPAAP